MECEILAGNVKRLASVVKCLSKTGDQLEIEAKQDQACNAVLRAANTMESLSISFAEDDPNVSFLVKTKAEQESVVPVFDFSDTNSISARPKLLLESVSMLHASIDEMSLVVTPSTVKVKSFVGDGRRALDEVLLTELKIDVKDLIEVDVDSPRTEMTFVIKEFKAFLVFCEALSLDIKLSFTGYGKPIHISTVRKPEDSIAFDGECFLSTFFQADSEALDDTLQSPPTTNINTTSYIHESTSRLARSSVGPPTQVRSQVRATHVIAPTPSPRQSQNDSDLFASPPNIDARRTSQKRGMGSQDLSGNGRGGEDVTSGLTGDSSFEKRQKRPTQSPTTPNADTQMPMREEPQESPLLDGDFPMDADFDDDCVQATPPQEYKSESRLNLRDSAF